MIHVHTHTHTFKVPWLRLTCLCVAVKKLLDTGSASEAEISKRFEETRDAYQRALSLTAPSQHVVTTRCARSPLFTHTHLEPMGISLRLSSETTHTRTPISCTARARVLT